MPTVLNINGFRIIIWPADHEPPHVHVFKGKGEAKINIGNNADDPFLVTIYGRLRIPRNLDTQSTANWTVGA